MNLPKNEFTFHIDTTCAKTKRKQEGDFTVKCILTNDEEVEIAIRTDRYNGGSKTINDNVALLNRTIAEMEIRLLRDDKNKILAPSWWIDSLGGRRLFDKDIVYTVFAEAMKAEDDWNKRLTELADKAEKKADASPVEKKD